MTEAEKIAYAKSFIDKLANGINPLDDSPIPEEDIVNHVRLSRCFFYVSTLLQREIDRESKKEMKAKKGERLPFSISPERLAQFDYSSTPISVTAMGKKINSLVKDDIRDMRIEKLPSRKIKYWLLDIGMLEWRMWDGGKQKLFPTDVGESIGIILQMWEQYGRKTPVVYLSREAQQFIIDNIDAVIAVRKERPSWQQEVDEGQKDMV